MKEPENYTGPRTYEAIVEAGGNVLAWGNFITIFINFVLLALVVFLMVKAVNRARASFERDKAVAEPAPEVTPDDILLLREIRDLLKK